MRLWQRNLALLLGIVVLAVVPLLFAENAQWAGADNRSTATIQELDQSYQPWFSSFLKLGDFEAVMFGIQAFLGSSLLFGFTGALLARRRPGTGNPGSEIRWASIVSIVAVGVFIALFFVQTEFGELRAFRDAVQGACLGTLAFFAGHRLGASRALRRASTRP